MAPRSKRVAGKARSAAVSGGRRTASGVLRRIKAGGSTAAGRAAPAALKCLAPMHLRPLLPGVFRHTRGKPFGPQELRSFVRERFAGKGFRMPSLSSCDVLLRGLMRERRAFGESAGPLGAWQPQEVRYRDSEGSACVDNLRGFVQGPRKPGGSTWVAWHEYGMVYRLRRVEQTGDGGKAGGSYQVVRNKAFKRLSCIVERRTLRAITDEGDWTEFKNSIVFEPRRVGEGRVRPEWSFIYLHSFSNKGTDYSDFPHYFGISSAPIRVVIPTAPQQEQSCFKDWMVWRGKKLRWRRIKFNSWFDYLSDRAGSRENDINLESLLEMRSRIHGVIQQEVRRVGDPKRVIVGGASQGCCVALDAALTYPQELGGVIGLVGHVLGNTPLDASKKNMPLHLFHETSDQEMRWSWVQDTVRRLVDAGFNVISKREADPSGSGHWIQDIEGEWIRSALRRIVHSSAAHS